MSILLLAYVKSIFKFAYLKFIWIFRYLFKNLCFCFLKIAFTSLLENQLHFCLINLSFRLSFLQNGIATMDADEYVFRSVVMIATGCVMDRIFHMNNCLVGVASRHEELRARFFTRVPGDPMKYFLYVAKENVGFLKKTSTTMRE